MIKQEFLCIYEKTKRSLSSLCNVNRLRITCGIALICLNLGCWGEVEPSNPFDEDTPLERQARGDAKITVMFPPDVSEAPADSYIEWTPVDEPENFTRIFFLDADTVSNTTTSRGA